MGVTLSVVNKADIWNNLKRRLSKNNSKMVKILLVLFFGLVLVTTQPTNNVAKNEGECRYEQALACAVEMEDLILNCIREDINNIPQCVVNGLGGIDGGNPCIYCICTVLQMVGLSC